MIISNSQEKKDQLKEFNYRFRLLRFLDNKENDKPLVLFIGLNPSIATPCFEEGKDDPTIKKLRQMVARWENNKYGGFYVGNLFPIVETNSDVLSKIIETIPPEKMDENNKHLQEMGKECKLVIFCWGAKGTLNKQHEKIRAMFPNGHCLGEITSNNQPRHPLYQKATTEPKPYKIST